MSIVVGGSIFVGGLLMSNNTGGQQPTMLSGRQPTMPDDSRTKKRTTCYYVRQRNFVVLFTAALFYPFTMVPIFYLPSYVTSLGFSKASGALTISLYGCGNLVGRPLAGWAADTFSIKCERLLQLCMSVCSIATFL